MPLDGYQLSATTRMSLRFRLPASATTKSRPWNTVSLYTPGCVCIAQSGVMLYALEQMTVDVSWGLRQD